MSDTACTQAPAFPAACRMHPEFAVRAWQPLHVRLRPFHALGQPPCTLFSTACNIPLPVCTPRARGQLEREWHVGAQRGNLRWKPCCNDRAALHSTGRTAAAPGPAPPPLTAGQPRRCGDVGRACKRLPPAPRLSAAGGGWAPFPAARHVRRCACCSPLLHGSRVCWRERREGAVVEAPSRGAWWPAHAPDGSGAAATASGLQGSA